MNAPARDRAWAVASAVADPELPAVTIGELGILRDVAWRDGAWEVTVTPTYSGCPAMTVIGWDIETSLAAAGIRPVRLRTVLAPAWSAAWLSPAGRAKLAAAGIAPPGAPGEAPPCPRCGAVATEVISAFGATACKSLHRCLACREPFEAFKPH